MRAFVERIEIYPEKRKDGCQIRKIVFNFPIPVDGKNVAEYPLELGTTVESVVCLSREKADDYIRISVQTKDLKRKETVCQKVNEDEK